MMQQQQQQNHLSLQCDEMIGGVLPVKPSPHMRNAFRILLSSSVLSSTCTSLIVLSSKINDRELQRSIIEIATIVSNEKDSIRKIITAARILLNDRNSVSYSKVFEIKERFKDVCNQLLIQKRKRLRSKRTSKLYKTSIDKDDYDEMVHNYINRDNTSDCNVDHRMVQDMLTRPEHFNRHITTTATTVATATSTKTISYKDMLQVCSDKVNTHTTSMWEGSDFKITLLYSLREKLLLKYLFQSIKHYAHHCISARILSSRCLSIRSMKLLQLCFYSILFEVTSSLYITYKSNKKALILVHRKYYRTALHRLMRHKNKRQCKHKVENKSEHLAITSSKRKALSYLRLYKDNSIRMRLLTKWSKVHQFKVRQSKAFYSWILSFIKKSSLRLDMERRVHNSSVINPWNFVESRKQSIDSIAAYRLSDYSDIQVVLSDSGSHGDLTHRHMTNKRYAHIEELWDTYLKSAGCTATAYVTTGMRAAGISENKRVADTSRTAGVDNNHINTANRTSTRDRMKLIENLYEAVEIRQAHIVNGVTLSAQFESSEMPIVEAMDAISDTEEHKHIHSMNKSLTKYPNTSSSLLQRAMESCSMQVNVDDADVYDERICYQQELHMAIRLIRRCTYCMRRLEKNATVTIATRSIKRYYTRQLLLISIDLWYRALLKIYKKYQLCDKVYAKQVIKKAIKYWVYNSIDRYNGYYERIKTIVAQHSTKAALGDWIFMRKIKKLNKKSMLLSVKMMKRRCIKRWAKSIIVNRKVVYLRKLHLKPMILYWKGKVRKYQLLRRVFTMFEMCWLHRLSNQPSNYDLSSSCLSAWYKYSRKCKDDRIDRSNEIKCLRFRGVTLLVTHYHAWSCATKALKRQKVELAAKIDRKNVLWKRVVMIAWMSMVHDGRERYRNAGIYRQKRMLYNAFHHRLKKNVAYQQVARPARMTSIIVYHRCMYRWRELYYNRVCTTGVIPMLHVHSKRIHMHQWMLLYMKSLKVRRLVSVCDRIMTRKRLIRCMHEWPGRWQWNVSEVMRRKVLSKIRGRSRLLSNYTAANSKSKNNVNDTVKAFIQPVGTRYSLYDRLNRLIAAMSATTPKNHVTFNDILDLTVFIFNEWRRITRRNRLEGFFARKVTDNTRKHLVESSMRHWIALSSATKYRSLCWLRSKK